MHRRTMQAPNSLTSLTRWSLLAPHGTCNKVSVRVRKKTPCTWVMGPEKYGDCARRQERSGWYGGEAKEISERQYNRVRLWSRARRTVRGELRSKTHKCFVKVDGYKLKDVVDKSKMRATRLQLGPESGKVPEASPRGVECASSAQTFQSPASPLLLQLNP